MKIDPEILDAVTVGVRLKEISRNLSVDVIRAMTSLDALDSVKVELAEIHILVQMLRKIHKVDTGEFCELVKERFPVLEVACMKKRSRKVVT